MEWISIKDRLPTTKDDILGCDWYNDEYRILVCESTPQEVWLCGELTKDKCFEVKGSICPEIGQGESTYWTEIPSKKDSRWIKFDLEKTKLRKDNELYSDEILIRLYNGNHYVACLTAMHWLPTFNMLSKFGDLESIDKYMSLPPQPKYIKPTKLSEKEQKIKDKKAQKWHEKMENDRKKYRKENPNNILKFRRYTKLEEE